MSNIDAERAFDRAVDLVIHTDNLTTNWTGRLVTVQTSLVVAEGILLGWKSEQPSLLIAALALLIGIVGVSSLLILSNIVVREHEYGQSSRRW